MSDSRARSAWDYPDCPSCESNVFVSQIRGDYYECNICNEQFNTTNMETMTPTEAIHTKNSGASGIHSWKFKTEHADLLEFLQGYKTYFKAFMLENDYGMDRRKAGRMFSVLHREDLIEPWGAKDNKTTWMLTDKGKDANPQELVE